MESIGLENADFVEPDVEFAEDDLFGLNDANEANLSSKFYFDLNLEILKVIVEEVWL